MRLNARYAEITVFVAGFIVMSFEIAGVRIVGPFIGTSVFVWSSVIGIVMGSLSVGYWLGGMLSARRGMISDLSWAMLPAALFIVLTAYGGEKVLAQLVNQISDFRLLSLVATIVLFAPANLFLGMVLPIAARLKVTQVNSSGRSVGSIYALSTAGSIAGTFLTGFLILPVAGFEKTIFSSALLLCGLAFAGFTLSRTYKGVVVAVALLALTIVVFAGKAGKEKNYVDADTLYNRVLIYDTRDPGSGREVRVLKVNNETSSAMFLDGDGLVFEVLKYYRLAAHFVPSFRNSLMIGGSGYAYPKDYLASFPDATMDVVEIDPALTGFARKYFRLEDSPRLRIFHEDGRTFINRSKERYDVIFMDAYKSVLTIPYQLTTLEAVEKMHGMLSDEGAVFANIISTFDTRNNHFLRAALATYKTVFNQVYLFAVKDPADTLLLQNYMLVALKSPIHPGFENSDPELQSYLNNLVTKYLPADLPILTDEYSPVDFYTNKMIREL